MKFRQIWPLPVHLLGLLLIFHHAFCQADEICLESEDLGDWCDYFENDIWPKKDCSDDQFFYDCVGNVIQQHRCQKLTYGPRKYDDMKGKCIARSVRETEPESLKFTYRYKRQTGSNAAGSACRFNTDCLTGMYCNSGLCTCLSNYVQEGSYCYEKINPSQTGCIYSSQCSSVWPGSTCTTGICTCPTSAPRAVETRDGFVCVRNLDECPLPALYGSKSVLYYSGGGTDATCTYGSTTAVCQSAASGGYSVAELYDCIVKTGAGQTQGVCCPNRAYTCTLQQETGSDGGTTATPLSRWWYNSLTETCETFTFYVSGSGNANNFETQQACQSYCQDRCTRGPTQYATTSTVFFSNKIISCQSATSACTSNYECSTVGSNQICCPTASFICSANGGVVVIPSSVATIYNPGYQTNNALGSLMTAQTRYYYDTTTRTCLTFSFLGTAGNFNNFRSRQECELFCAATVCDRGTPLSDSTGVNQACSSNSQCPTTHTCNNNVCCPSKQTICSQDLRRGTACSTTSFGTRYWYNPVTRQCESFTFGGCNGNDNNFATQLDCQNYCSNAVAEPICQQGSAYRDNFGNFYQCSTTGIATNCPANHECYYDGTRFGCCPTRTYTCALPSANGRVCGPQTIRWYYDTTTQSCTTFVYLGCDGNSNNFPNRELCENYCGTGNCPNNGSPYVESTGSPRVCSSAVTCPNNYECTNVVLSTTTQVSYCCPTRGYTCSQAPLSGNTCGSGSVTRYYFSTSTRTCTTFTYNGCGGNSNNFATLAQCQNFCNSAGCNAGESVYTNPTTNSVLTCNANIASTCPAGYTCRYDSVTRNNVCCGSTDGGVCPNGERAYVDALTQTARQCTPSSSVPCPGTFLCRLSTTANRYYCCSPSTTTQCPNGYASYLSPITNLPQVCTLGTVSNTCPSRYSCQTRVIGSFQGYCCSISPLCPTGMTVYQTTTGRPQSCTFGGPNVCPASYQCQTTSSGSVVGYCCSSTANLNVCLTSAPYLLNNSPVVCNAQSPTNQCPAGYSCQLNAGTNTYYCCAGTGGTGICQSGTPYLDNNVARSCSPTVASCPLNYNCQRSRTGNAYYCCSGASSTVCGTAGIPYQPGGVPVSCSPGDNRCPARYNCQLYSQTNTYYCCMPTALVCTSGQPSLLNGSPQSCSPNTINTCPTGYTCTRDSLSNLYYCCSGGASSLCPGGGTLSAQTCSPNVPGTCVGGTCQFITSTNRYQCCLNAATQRCPNGGTSNGIVCSPNTVNSCGAGATCQLITGLNQYQCCTNTGTQACPNGGTTNGVICSPNTPNTCGVGATCQFISGLNRYQCCTNTGSQTCPNGGTTNGVICSPNTPNTCGVGATCQLIAGLNRYQCCTNTGSQTCPNGGTTNGVICSPNTANTCGVGATCQLIRGLNRYQCCTNTGTQACPNGGTTNGVICSPNTPNTCGVGATCQLIPGLNRYQCCTNTGSQTCPNGGTTNGVICSPNTANTCGVGATCQLIPGLNRYQCCTNTGTQACPTGGTTNGVTCSPNVPNACGTGANCQLISSTNRYQCCVGAVQGTCPQGGTLTQTTCSPNVAGSCPGGTCQLIAGTGRYQCCTGAITRNCPNGQLAYVDPSTQRTQTCIPNIVTSCPNTFTCTTVGSQFICCPSTQQASCPNNAQLYTNPITRQPQSCVFGAANACPTGYSCQTAPGTTTSYCCQSTTQNTPQCPTGRTPYTSTLTRTVQYCTPNTPNNCPNGYSCTLGVGVAQFVAGQTYLCCSGGGTSNNICSRGSAYLYPNTNLPLICQPFGNTCPAGYTCQRSTTAGQYYCCGAGSGGGASAANGCPSGRAYLATGTNSPQICFPNQPNNCPFGYSCVYSYTFFRYQCCSSTFASEAGLSGNKSARNEPEPVNVTKPAETNLVTERPKTMCQRKPCKAGEYGCKKRLDCLTNLCENERCTCPSNMMISHEGHCVQHCANKYINENGECVLAPMKIYISDAPDEPEPNPRQFLDIPCSNSTTAKGCSDKMSYCNKVKQRCQCYATYEARGDECVLSAEYRKNNSKVEQNDDLRR